MANGNRVRSAFQMRAPIAQKNRKIFQKSAFSPLTMLFRRLLCLPA
jgi:hypothetical protein